MKNKLLIEEYGKLTVALLPSKHFTEALLKRVFPLNIIGIAAIVANDLKVGEEKEVYSDEKFKATVEVKKVREDLALLITGWKGIRISNRNKTKRITYEN